jgi:LacI family transcriptional regulator
LIQRSSAPTITDVARHAGVSMKTVSRVLNGEPNVQPAMRERVMTSVTALNYRPNIFARSLAGSRSYLLGLLYYAPSAAFIVGLQQGATSRCRDLGYHLVVESLDPVHPDFSGQLDHMVSALRPDGLILAPPMSDNLALLKLLSDAGIPCVRISPGSSAEALAEVTMDDESAASELTAYLIGLGHRRIGFIRGDVTHAVTPLRLAGHLSALRAAGIPEDSALITTGDFQFRSGLDAAEQLLALEDPPTAIFASNDDMAMGAVVAAHRRGLLVPADLSVAGFDDSPMASLVWPQLTTVRQPVVEMARTAVDLLVARPSKDDAAAPPATPPVWVLPHTLIARGSTAAPPAR